MAYATGDDTTRAYAETLKAFGSNRGLTFVAHPLTTGHPMKIPATASSAGGIKALDKQHKRIIRQQMYGLIDATTARMQRAASEHQWDRCMQEQTVKQMWRHNRSITAYQAWTWY